MDKDIAKLLMAAILDNTLNFTANITTERDKNAYKKLELLINEYDYSSTPKDFLSRSAFTNPSL